MSTRDLIDKLQITNPCTADWDSMRGTDQVRFCEHCNLSVSDLSQMTPKRAMRLVIESRGRLCIRLHQPVAISPRLHQIGRRVSRFAAGAFTAALTVSSAVAAQPSQASSRGHQTNRLFVAQATVPGTIISSSGSIAGTIFDQHGAVIPGAGITLGNETSTYLLGTITNDHGEYKFEQLEPGTYRLTIEASGFNRAEVEQIVLSENGSQQIDSRLEVAGIFAQVQVLNDSNQPGQEMMGGVTVVVAAAPFIQAAQSDDLAEVEALLSKVDVNLRDKNLGTTALEHAVVNGNREMVQLLLRAGADVNARNGSQETALMMLGEEGTGDIAWDLINAGAYVNVEDEDGDTPLTEAAMIHNLGALTTLIHAGAKVEHRNKAGVTALMNASGNGHIASVRALIRSGADMNARDKDGKSVLDYAIQNDHEKVIKLLRSFGALPGLAENENEGGNQ